MSLYRFYRESTGEWIEATPEKWRWEAHYTDGSVLKQFDDESQMFHQFKEIEQDKLNHFCMVSEGKAPLILMWKEGRKLIHFYTNYAFDVGGPNERKMKMYCFGYQEGQHKVIFCIMPDDGIVITDDHNKIKLR